MTSDEITALFDRRDEAYSLHDSSALAADYADNCVVESPIAGPVIGRTAVEKLFRDVFSAFPDFKNERKDLLISGNEVVWTASQSGTDTGGFLGQAPTGKPFRIFVVFLYTFDHRQIVRERRVYDVNGLLMQLGTDFATSSDTAQMYRATLERTLVEHELKIAAEVQRALLPQPQHTGAGFQVAAASVPCRAIGGDFFDYFDFPSGAFGFALGDVAGKGPPAALLAAELQGILAAYSHSGGTPADIMTHVNRLLGRRDAQSRFATVLYAVLSCDGQLAYCNAGHNPPLLVGRRGVRRLETGGLILGAFQHATFEEATLRLDPDDVLVVFSDGITEALNVNEAEFGEGRLLSCVNANRELPPGALLECVLETVHKFAGSAVQNDDRTALVLRYSGA